MAQFLFVEDYIKHVANLKAAYPLDEAMVKAVDGADYHQAGQTERDILFVAGLRPGMSVFDLGCGSGRLATALTKERISLQYLGTDVVQDLLDYAASKTPVLSDIFCTANCQYQPSLPAWTLRAPSACSLTRSIGILMDGKRSETACQSTVILTKLS
jgi:SAM-dependent methyltransferase